MSGKSFTPPRDRGRSPSPIPRRSCHSGREVRVVEKATASIVYPILTRTNYSEWALVMRVNLQAAGLWDAINKGSADYLQAAMTGTRWRRCSVRCHRRCKQDLR
jgi:hypothetical protein